MHGYTATTSQLRTVPPKLSTLFLVVTNPAAFPSALRDRGPFMHDECLLAIFGYVMLTAAERSPIIHRCIFHVASASPTKIGKNRRGDGRKPVLVNHLQVSEDVGLTREDFGAT